MGKTNLLQTGKDEALWSKLHTALWPKKKYFKIIFKIVPIVYNQQKKMNSWIYLQGKQCLDCCCGSQLKTSDKA